MKRLPATVFSAAVHTTYGRTVLLKPICYAAKLKVFVNVRKL